MKTIGLSPAEVWVFAQGFDRSHSMTLCLCGKHRSCVDRFAIQQNRICTGEALLIPELYSMKTQSAQGGKQCGRRRRVDDVFNSVDLECDVH